MRGEQNGSASDDPGDVLRFGRDRPASRRWRSRVLLACLLLAVLVVVVVRTIGSEPRTVSHPTAIGGPVLSHPPPILNISVGHRLLGVRAGWQLVARGSDELLRIQLAQGRVSWTYVPPLETASPAVDFVVGAHETVIQPSDVVAGYVVPDGSQARPLTGPLSAGGPVVPGPSGTQTVWVVTGALTKPQLSLLTLSGRRVGPVITVPPGAPQILSTAVSDGRGDVLVTTDDYADYDAAPGRERAEPGTIIAVGPASWLTETCGTNSQGCRYQVIDAASGHRRLLAAPATESPYYFTWPPAGVIAPAGTIAAVAENGVGGTPTVHLINLRTGATRDLGIPLADAGISAQGEMIWSPDGRWLFVVTAAGKILAVDPRSGRAESLGVRLPRVSQLAIRP